MSMEPKRGLLFHVGSFAAACAAGGVLALGCAAALAQLMVVRSLPHSVLWPFATGALAVGCLSGGYLLALLQKHHGLLYGALQGALCAAVLYGCSYLGGTEPDPRQLLRMALVFLAGCIGGLAGLAQAEHAGKRRR